MDLLRKKIEEDEKKAKKYVKNMAAMRVIWICLFSVSLILILVAGVGIPICILCLLMFGVSQSNCNKGKKSLALIQDYKLYAEKLRDKRDVTVDVLSDLVCQPVPVIVSNLNEMIQKGYILKVEERSDYYRYAYIGDTAIRLPDAEQRVMVSVTCKACGGVTEIPKGKNGTCVYCDSRISG